MLQTLSSSLCSYVHINIRCTFFVGFSVQRSSESAFRWAYLYYQVIFNGRHRHGHLVVQDVDGWKNLFNVKKVHRAFHVRRASEN